MNAQLRIAGALLEGGYFAGSINVAGIEYGLIVAPKAEGEHKDAIWIPRYKDVPEAKSYNDGLANTEAMAAAGSKIAKWSRELAIGGFNDWYLPAVDELEICYRAFKPTADENSQYARSGINVSAVPPTYPYSPTLPAQTANELFREEAAEAFDAVWYWSSTQHASNSNYAWAQGFGDGSQDDCGKGYDCRAHAVRRFKL